ncbi:uncharacterized protein LOC134801633 [Cydia splendana]|uniref:uncharacterized protein LOC134801633 n=1 Tax=Cydia splendana TaxID=1100963 RepID=UPI00300C15A6
MSHVPEAPTPVPEKTKLTDDVVTLSLFSDDDAPIQSQPSAPVAAVPEDVKVQCKDCAAVIDGFSFWCVQCLCGALCVACAASEAHYAHYVLRSPKGATQNQTQAVLAVIRKQLVMENLLTLYETDGEGVKVEVKYELEEPLSPPSPAPAADPLAAEAEPRPRDPLAVEAEEAQEAEEAEEAEPRPDATVEKRVDEETDQHTVKRLRRIDPRTRIINSTVQMKQKLLKVPVAVLRRFQTDHTLNSEVLRATDIITTTSNVRASQQKHSPNVLRKDQKVQKLTISDLRTVKLVTSRPSNIRESQVLTATASNLRRSLNVPIITRTVQALTTGDLKSQAVVQATTSNSRVSQDNANRPMRDPSEMILRTVTSEPTVQLQPLTSADIMKWSADRKRRRND